MYRLSCFVAALAVVVAPTVTSTAAEMGFWSTVGAAGIVDEDSTSKVIFHDSGSAAVRPGVASGTVKLRYPVTNGPAELEGFDPTVCMRLSVRDTGASARVVVQLVAINAVTGVRSGLGTFDSDQRLTTGSDQYRAIVVCGLSQPEEVSPLHSFDHAKYSYHVDVTLIRSDSAGNPGIKHLGLFVLSSIDSLVP
jgi:hypothetical protein